MPGILQFGLTMGDCCCLPIGSHSISSPCYQSKWLTSLGITRWQTVVLLLSVLSILTATANLSSWFPVFLIVLLIVAAIFVAVHMKAELTSEYCVELVVYSRQTLSSSARLLIAHYVLTAVGQINYSLSAKYKHVQNHSNLFECEGK